MKNRVQQLPNSTQKLCKTLMQLSRKTWRDLRDSQRMNLSLGEESITDFTLLNLKKRHRTDVIIEKFTKPIEGRRTGADWEWWFTDQRHWFGLRVQAKVIDAKTMMYNGLNKRTRGVLQYDRLISSAQQRGCIPLYCFYNYMPTATGLRWPCSYVPSQVDLVGCAITDAHVIKNLNPNRKTPISVLVADMWPWSCLVCCGDGNTSLPQRVRSFICQIIQGGAEIPELTSHPPLSERWTSLQGKSKSPTAVPFDENLVGIVIIKEPKEEA